MRRLGNQLGPVFVYYLRGLRTGGPEALHQLVHAIRDLGREAYLVPVPGTENEPRVRDFDHYDCPEVNVPRDIPEAVVVAPEVAIGQLRGVKSAERMIWWLSIDNAPVFEAERLRSRTPWSVTRSRDLGTRQLRRTVGIALGYTDPQRRTRALMASANHLTQSAYAWSYLQINYGISPCMVSDYTRDMDALDVMKPRAPRSVAYNPAKGAELIEEVRRRRPDIDWRPIQGMTGSEVVNLLSTTEVYLDLGHHPGRDRIPREAALCGTVVLVLRRGSAAFTEDVPIDEHYKISAVEPYEDTVRALDMTFADSAAARRSQEPYRRWIRGERKNFVDEVRTVFIEGRRESGLALPHDLA